ncbi:MBL fold metallo-hydrolase [Deinococcus psychrotolerans]|uniref:MBL fold metallo-hydrolase n=1 Tax=Deinococcus psychrotolerans TaxID=2489213 RepID=A0A3G8YDM2_9DEIO|nr:MBL fold metallo-hydrolase [Deinococcus psychrotolerans]AZI43422.1 MBL fold metallo-hydrolase [Deinococcus psychrotolerans]
MTVVRVVPLAAGECLNIAALTERGAAWRVKVYPAGFALLLHPVRGAVLFDTGYSFRVPELMRRWPGLLYGLITPVRLQPWQTPLAQLARLGITAQDVRHVIVSHLHADHVGALRDFPAADIYLDAGAYPPLRGLRGLRAVRRAFLPELLPPDFEARSRALTFKPAPPAFAPFEQVADVFGDGSVYALPVPGHAPGMIALVVRTREDAALDGNGGGLTLLASDAAWSAKAARSGEAGHPLANLLSWDVKQGQRSREQLRDWLAAHPRTRVIVSHDAPEPESSV